MARLIDADAIIRAIKSEWCKNCHNNYDGIKCLACEADDFIGLLEDAPTVDAVPAEKYNELKERYKRTMEVADILDTALRQYQRLYGE